MKYQVGQTYFQKPNSFAQPIDYQFFIVKKSHPKQRVAGGFFFEQ
jgi:hypothetical protein